MRYLLLSLSLVILAACDLSPKNPFEPGDVVDTTLVIRGTTGQRWAGAIDDDDSIRSMDGRVPQTIHLRARENSFVGGTIQKETEGRWVLVVCLALNGVEKRCGHTDAEFGLVSLSGTVENKHTLR